MLGAGDIATLADTTRPQVTITQPLTSSPGPTSDVPVSTVITASFSEDMAPATLSTSSFTLSCAAPCTAPAGSVSYNAGTRNAAFAPNAVLAANTTYTVRITTAVTDLAGNALAGNQAPLPAASDYLWRFTTQTPPQVTATAPISNATGVAINTQTISATFSEPVQPISGSASFTVSCAAPCTSPAGVVTLDSRNTTALFTLAGGSALEQSTLYTATVSGATSRATGLTMSAPFVWRFTTGATADTTRPQVSATQPRTSNPGPTAGVATNTVVSATFTEDMAPATLTTASFTLSCANPCVSPGRVVSYNVGSRTATLTPSTVLDAGTLYTATVTTAATDIAGNALAGNQAALPAASNYVWSFTTLAAAPPSNVTVQSTNPADAATDVCPSATINATFAVPSGLRMDGATVNNATFTVVGPAPGFTPVTASSVLLDATTGRIASFTPQSALTTGTTYTATIKGGNGGVKDLANPANTLLSDFSWRFTVAAATGQCLTPVLLRSAAPFGIFGGSAGMTNMGIQTVINGDIGTTAASTTVTGFHDAGPGCSYTETPLNQGMVNGQIYTDAVPPSPACPSEGNATTFAIAQQARADTLQAYNDLVAVPPGPDPAAGSLANLVLAPGSYTAAAGTFSIQGGDLTLDAQGNGNAVWVFQMASSLTVGGPGAAFPSSIILVNGAQAKNVFWQVGSKATINAGGGGTMVGTVISQSGVEVSTAGSTNVITVNGRLLSLNASVTVVDAVINVPAP